MSRVRDDARLAGAVKETDGFFATFVVSSWSLHVVRWAAAHGRTPNQVTAASMVLAVVAAVAFATGTPAGMLVGAVLLQLAFVADCVDGQLARYTGTGTALGSWLDKVSDRAKEVGVYAGLALGGERVGQPDVWLLAGCALALQALRHQADLAFAVSRDIAPSPDDGGAADDRPVGRQIGTAGVRTAATLERSWLRWAKRIVVLPIGERFALISVTAALAGPRATFIALLVWGVVATAYMVSGRLLRSVAAAAVPPHATTAEGEVTG